MESFSTCLFGDARTLLLATDGSRFCDGAAQEAIFFGEAYRAKVIVLHVVKINAESLKSADSAVRMRRQEMEPYFDQFRKMAKDSGVECEVVVVGSNHPEEAIIEQAKLREADVILIGRNGKTGPFSIFIGQMTGQILDLGFPRVLVVPTDFIITGTRVLLATDDSPGSMKAVEEAMCMGHRSLTLQHLHVLSVARQETDVPQTQKIVDAICFRIGQAYPQVICEPLVRVGEPAKTIIHTAREQKTDMIIIGGQGKRGMARKLLGHVTRKVTSGAHCAVLVINS